MRVGCDQSFNPSRCNKYKLFHGYKPANKADYTIVLKEFIGKLIKDTTLAICGSCKTLLLRYGRVSKDAERIKMLSEDM